jgi:glycerol-3-phosphate O-acyltransferase
MIETLRNDAVRDVLLVPTAVYWGRAPQKEGSWLRLLFTENWALTSRMRKFGSVLVNGPQRHGGARRADQPAFHARCLAHARRRRAA